MKKLILILVAAVGIAPAFAQTTAGRTTFGLRAGINFQNINGQDFEGDKLENDMMLGFHAGANVEIPIAPQFYIQPGVLFSQKGARADIEFADNETYSATTTINYIEVPINLLFKPELGNGFLLLGFGPYIGYGIGGRSKYDSFGDNEAGEYDIKFMNEVGEGDANDVRYFRAFDAGGNILFGYEFINSFSIQLNTQLGMVKINPEYNNLDDDKTVMKNTGFGLSLGYRF